MSGGPRSKSNVYRDRLIPAARLQAVDADVGSIIAAAVAAGEGTSVRAPSSAPSAARTFDSEAAAGTSSVWPVRSAPIAIAIFGRDLNHPVAVTGARRLALASGGIAATRPRMPSSIFSLRCSIYQYVME